MVVVILTPILFLSSSVWSQKNVSINSRIQLLKCGREGFGFKQFCKLDIEELKIALPIQKKISFDNHDYDLESVFVNNKITPFRLGGLTPKIKFTLDWSNSGNCWKDQFRNDKMSLFSNNSLLGRVFTGTNNYSFSLVSEEGTALYVYENSINSNLFELSFVFNFFDASHPLGDGSMGGRQIPSACHITASNIRIEFDELLINRDLDTLSVDAGRLKDLILKSAVLHGLYVDRNKGALCSIYHMVNTLKLAEGLPADSKLDNLSFNSIKSVESLISHALSIGAVSQEEMPKKEGTCDHNPVLDYDEFFRQKEALLGQECENNFIYTVSMAPFVKEGKIINQQGYQNANEYFLAQSQLKEDISAALALIVASKNSIENKKKYNWIFDYAKYVF
ncbi:MAG: hypothetical protein HQK53_02255 [Oligoflexia bacterium]|nr:hypothetical protein [Oligoflexia bacterium]